MEIDYSSIPHAKKPASVFDNFKTATRIVFGAMSAIVIVALLTLNNDTARNTTFLILGTIVLMTYYGIILYRFYITFKKSTKQANHIQQFASRNHWTYESEPHISDNDVIPPDSRLIPSRSRISYRINGKNTRGEFSLYLLQGEISQPLIVNLLMKYRLFGFLSVIRTNYPLSPQQLDGYYTCNYGQYGYAVHTANAATRESLEQLFSLIA